MFRNIKESAVFVADSHVNEKNRDSFFLLLQKIEELNPPQIFFMGDIFDLLVSEVKSSIDKNIDVIKKMDMIASKIPSYYFEGNHDFSLKSVFRNITVFERKEQPCRFLYKDIKVALSHGDIWTTKRYEIYINILQNKTVLRILSFFNEIIDDFIAKKIREYNYSKNLCKKIENFENIIKKRMKNYKDVDMVIEGHFHQNVELVFDNLRYINLPSFACGGKYGLFKEGRIVIKSL